MTAVPEYKTNIRFVPGEDTRDDIGPDDDLQEERALGLGIVFELYGKGGTLAWSINTGWFHRPVTTDGLVHGPQQRASRPGVDRMFRHAIEAFPKPLYPMALSPEKTWNIESDEIRDALMDALTSGGEQAVFHHMKMLYSRLLT